MEDRSSLFNEIQKFSQRKLKKVETNVVTATGDKVVEKRSAKGLQTTDNKAVKNDEGAPKDLQVGLIIPGLMIGSQDVAHSQKTIEEYEITHILNLAGSMVDNHFENEYNYLTLNINDKFDEDLKKHFDEVFEFIDEGRHRGNCFVHCDASKPGLSRSTAFCIAYLMAKEDKRYQDAFNEVKEARSFVRPNDGFVEQLKKYDEELFGEKKKEEIEDPFTKKKRLEIEAEKEMLKGTTSVKNKLEMFKKVDEEKKVQSPGPNKLKSDWINNEANSSEDKNSEGQEKPPPKKLTSILSIFQQPKEGRDSSDNSVKKVAANSGPVKKWKPVETKGLQRAKDPQVKVNEHKDYSQYEKVKKSKSGTKWGTKDTVKRTKSREFKESSKKPNDENKLNEKLSETSSKSKNVSSLSLKEPKTKLATSTPKSLNKKEATSDSTVALLPPPQPSSPLIKENEKVTSSSENVKQLSQDSKLDKNKMKIKRRASKEIASENKFQLPHPPQPPTQPPPPPPPPSPPSSSLNKVKTISKKVSNSNENLKLKSTSKKTDKKEKDSTPLSQQNKNKEIASIDDTKSKHVNNYKSQTKNTSLADVEPLKKVPVKEQVLFQKPIESVVDKVEAKSEQNGSKVEDNKRMVFNVSRPRPKNIRGGAIINADEMNNKSYQYAFESKKATSKAPTIETIPAKTKPNTDKNKTEEPILTQKSEPNKPFSKEQDKKFIQNKKSTINKDEEITKAVSEADKSKSKSKPAQNEESDTNKMSDHHCNRKGLTRSSTAEILKLIKSKTKSELSMPNPMSVIDEDDEIDMLLEGLENEGIENIDWGELGIGLNEVKDIVENAEESEAEEEEEEETEETEEETEETEETEEEMEDRKSFSGLEVEGEEESAEEGDKEEKEIQGLFKSLEKEGINSKENRKFLNDQSNKPATKSKSKQSLSSMFAKDEFSSDEFEIELEEASG